METIMGLMTKLTKIAVPMGLMLALTAGGCSVAGDLEGRPADEFMAADEESAVTRLANTQIAAGARTDATLRPYHFEDGALNSLGEEKLDFIVTACDNKESETVVYLDVPAGEGEAGKRLAQARQDAVTEYLLNKGLSKDSFRLESGYNPSNGVSAALAGPQGPDDAGGAAPAAKAPSGGLKPMADLNK
jgi:hypothetical protein